MISIAAERITHVGPFPITNTVVDTLFVDVILIALAIYTYKNAKVIPGKFQSVMEIIIGGFYGLTEQITGKHAAKIFPFIMTFFLFILVANWSGLLPVLGAIEFGHGEHKAPLFRSASTDLNTTIALAIVSLVATHAMSIQTFGLQAYIHRFFTWNPTTWFQGILEIISEITKIVSFSFRLFGNIFVGEIILGTLTAAFAFFAPIPVIMYEFFVGAIQASIFALLTMAFMAIFTTPHGGESHK